MHLFITMEYLKKMEEQIEDVNGLKSSRTEYMNLFSYPTQGPAIF